MDIKSVREYLGKDWEAVKEKIETSLMSDIALLNATNSSILSNSGKQLRPLLALLVARACSGHQISEATVRYAAASELLHNATLLHDDVADGSVKRRGAPTIMSLMGPSVSVLVGDYWLVKAMDLIIDADDAAGDSCVMKIFSKTLKDLAEGEMLQLQKAQKGDTDENDYLRIIYSKTASLFEAASVSAAISVGASEAYVQAARVMGYSHGRIMFRHILPNVTHLAIIYFTTLFAASVMLEVTASYLGLGAQNFPSWGMMISLQLCMVSPLVLFLFVLFCF